MRSHAGMTKQTKGHPYLALWLVGWLVGFLVLMVKRHFLAEKESKFEGYERRFVVSE